MKSVVIFLVLAFVSVDSYSQINKPKEKKSEWHIRISPHFWFINLKGQIIRPPVPVFPSQPIEPPAKREIDISFGELKSSIKFAFMGSGQYVQNRFLTRFNVISFILEGEVITPLDLILQDTHLRFAYLSGDAGFGYDVINKPNLNLFALAGLKFVYMDIDVKSNVLGRFPVEGARDRWFMDPVIGTYFIYKPYKWMEFNAYGDLGLIFGDQVTAQFISEVDFFLTKWFYLSAGYRIWFLEVPKTQAIYNGSIFGSVVKIGFQIH